MLKKVQPKSLNNTHTINNSIKEIISILNTNIKTINHKLIKINIFKTIIRIFKNQIIFRTSLQIYIISNATKISFTSNKHLIISIMKNRIK